MTNKRGVQTEDSASASIMNSTVEANLDEVNKGYIAMNCLVVSLGFMQFGIGMNSWSTLSAAFEYNWSF